MRRLILALLLCACAPDAPSTSIDAPVLDRMDQGEPDQGQPDRGQRDRGQSDTMSPDAALPDAMSPDAALPDAMPPDALMDAGAPDMPPRCQITGPTPLRRLTPTQYRGATAALGLDARGVALTQDDGPIISQLAAERFVTAAEHIAAEAEIPPCDPGDAPAECFTAFITPFATDAFRRLPTVAELDWLIATFDAAEGTYAERARQVVEVVVQAPQFLYRFEPAEAGVLTPAAAAERLAFAITDAPPDVERPDAPALAASPAGREKLRRFFMRWAGLDHIGTKAEPFAAGAAQAEAAGFIDQVIAADGRFADLLTARGVADLDPAIADLYGVPPDAIELPANERAGLLTRVAFLAAHAGPVAQSPIQRGVFVRRTLLCQPLPPPPPTVDNTPVERGGAADDGQPRSLRELTTRATGANPCAACHALINPPGYLFSHYDARGRFVREEHGIDRDGMPYVVPVDARSVVAGADLPAEMDDAVAFSQALAESAIAHDCLVRQWLAFALERPLTAADACDVADLQRQFTASGGRLQVLQTGLARLACMRLKGE